jgi:hypothetical protein
MMTFGRAGHFSCSGESRQAQAFVFCVPPLQRAEIESAFIGWRSPGFNYSSAVTACIGNQRRYLLGAGSDCIAEE